MDGPGFAVPGEVADRAPRFATAPHQRYHTPMTTRPLRVSDLSGSAATAVRTARSGHPVDVLSRGHVVARIVPVTESDASIPGLTVVAAEGRLVPPARRVVADGADVLGQLDADRGE